MTGKGDRWGGDRLGRSEPAFLSASTIALPPSTCTARREAGQHHLRLFAARPANVCWLLCCFEACAGQIVCRLCPPAVALFSRLCACSPLPCPLPISSCPRSVCFALPPPVHSMCARIIRASNTFASCKTVLLAAATRACSGGPCAGSLLTFCPFFLQSPLILGHGLV